MSEQDRIAEPLTAVRYFGVQGDPGEGRINAIRPSPKVTGRGLAWSRYTQAEAARRRMQSRWRPIGNDNPPVARTRLAAVNAPWSVSTRNELALLRPMAVCDSRRSTAAARASATQHRDDSASGTIAEQLAFGLLVECDTVTLHQSDELIRGVTVQC